MKHKISYSIYIHYADSREKKSTRCMLSMTALKNGFEAASWCDFFNNHGCSDQFARISIN